jgi:hypothetical protein
LENKSLQEIQLISIEENDQDLENNTLQELQKLQIISLEEEK